MSAVTGTAVLTTADLAATSEMSASKPTAVVESSAVAVDETAQPLSLLFTAEAAEEFRSSWDAVQIGFVDDPGQAVRRADELVAHVMTSLAQTFSSERARIEGQFNEGGIVNTETHRVALRRYRSFFQRLLSLDRPPALAGDTQPHELPQPSSPVST